jgi:hypothetical protein
MQAAIFAYMDRVPGEKIVLIVFAAGIAFLLAGAVRNVFKAPVSG